ncbi:MAG: hypothetical protein JXI43_09855 [Tissierellales bacterium]|nr:hypothetical protein [Tissierellales bacterium]
MEDKAVEEIRSRRKKLLNEEFHGSIKELAIALKELESTQSHKIVDLHRLKRSRKIC